MKPAVAVRTKVPGAVPVKSRLHATLGPDGATALYRAFLLDRLDAVAALESVTVIVAYTPPEAAAAMAALAPAGLRLLPQRGADLGERMSALLDGLLADGHPAAIAMGADSPTLPMAWVAEAVDALTAGTTDLALGPADDGGYYLIGLRAPCPPLFRGVPWSTGEVARITLERAREARRRVHLLPRWFDVDTEADLRRLETDLRAAVGELARTRAVLHELRA
jgi:uncharacterized protein